jgi:ribosomal protein S18 acetylase RimI-like enzyme
MTIDIRPATAADIDAIRMVGSATWPATYAFAGDAFVAAGLAAWWSDEALRASLETTSTLVAELDGSLVGVGNLDLRREPPTIWKLYVLPAAQGHRVGSSLLHALIALAEDRPITLEYVDGNDHAAQFYQRHGFRETRREPPEVEGGPETVWMTRNPLEQIR